MRKPNETHVEIATEIYQDFCEGGANNHPFQEAWDTYEEKHGSIVFGSVEENLIFQAILYGVQVGADNYYNPSVPPPMKVAARKVRHKQYPLSGFVIREIETLPVQYEIDWGGGCISTEFEESILFED